MYDIVYGEPSKITQCRQFLALGVRAPDSPVVPHSLAGAESPACPRGGRWPPPRAAPCACILQIILVWYSWYTPGVVNSPF